MHLVLITVRYHTRDALASGRDTRKIPALFVTQRVPGQANKEPGTSVLILGARLLRPHDDQRR